MKIEKLIIAAIMCGALSGCAPVRNGAVFDTSITRSPSNGNAKIIAYAPQQSMLGNLGEFVTYGDKTTCRIVSGTYDSMIVPAKDITLNIKETGLAGDEQTKEVNAKSKHVYYLRISFNRSKQQAQAAGGLIGLFLYNAANNGDKNSHYFIVDSIGQEQAKEELNGLTKSTVCK